MEQPFAHLPIEERAAAMLILRDALEVCPDKRCLESSQLEQCEAETLDAVTSAHIETHMHLFAIRRFRECIRSGSCDAPLA